MTQERIALLEGPQAWRLIRTRRDGASKMEVETTLGPAMARMLRAANDSENPWEIFRTGNDEYRIGAARPILVANVSRDPEPLPDGNTIADRQKGVGDVIPTVRGGTPWYVDVRFWWRGSPTSIAYPAIKVDWLGRRVHALNGADWVLDKAVALPDDTADPGGETWVEEQGKRVKAAAPFVGLGLATMLAVGGAIALGAYVLAARAATPPQIGESRKHV